MPALLATEQKVFSSRAAIVLVCMIIVICVLGIFGRDLWTPDEPRVAAISLEMSRDGNLVIPHLASQPFLEKPPLYFAVAANLIKSLGEVIGTTPAIRLTTTLFGLGTLLAFFLLARTLYNQRNAITALVVFGTMSGFVEASHWIRVDAALLFFVVACLWSLVEAYRKEHWLTLLPAGILAAGAFLSKGPIGPLLIFIPWCGLFYTHFQRRRPVDGASRGVVIAAHLAGLGIFIFGVGAWVWLLRHNGSPELWHEWFYVNQIGRLTGAAAGKGHLRRGQPWYYLVSLALYSLPWLPLLPVWGKRRWKDFRRTKKLEERDLFLLVWGVGMLVFLTLPATKRGIYFYPALPAFALMAARVLEEKIPNWFTGLATAWTAVCAFVMFIITLLPAFAGLIEGPLPESAGVQLGRLESGNLIAIPAIGLALILLIRRRRIDPVFRFALASALLLVTVFCGPVGIINQVKSMRSEMEEFTARIPRIQRPRIAGCNFSETALANFYYYCDWSVPQIHDKARLEKILQHRDQDFDSLIINRTHSLAKLLPLPYHVLAVGNPRHSRKNRRKLFWVAGGAEIKPPDSGRNVVPGSESSE